MVAAAGARSLSVVAACVLFVVLLWTTRVDVVGASSFTIVGNEFEKDGQPFRLVSGDIHYWRVPRADWPTRLKTCRAMGLNSITTYINWALHEPRSGEFVFEGNLDVAAWIQAAADADLLVIVRIGPYITAEVDFGGFPWWLSTVNNITLRTTNAQYLALVDRYFDQLVPQLVPLQYSQGGPIVDFQVEDDTITNISLAETRLYYEYLAGGLRKRNIDALINTLCYPVPTECDKALITTPGTWLALELPYMVPIELAIDLLRVFYPHGPVMVMEVYPGWFDQEGHLPHQTQNASQFALALYELFSHNCSVSIYPVMGGTNFAFSNGGEPPTTFGPVTISGYAAITTTYDFDAPIDEAGDPTPKYSVFRSMIGKFVPLPPVPVPSPEPKGNYGAVPMSQSAALFDELDNFASVVSAQPLTMESLNFGYGYVLYRTQLSGFTGAPASLYVSGLQDRALVYLDDVFCGRLGWALQTPTSNLTLAPLPNNSSPVLSILVENKGRCAPEIVDFSCARKGIVGVVVFAKRVLAGNWTNVALPMLASSNGSSNGSSYWPFQWQSAPTVAVQKPLFYRGLFEVNGSEPLTSYLLMDGWGHGFVAVNGINLGRFSALGPQRSLLVPHSVLHLGTNELVLFESDTYVAAALPSDSARTVSLLDYRLWS